jgi:hypothetical protein
MQASQKQTKVIFNAENVFKHLQRLKAAAEAKAAEDAKTAGREGDIEVPPWWPSALAFDWADVRKGGNGTFWMSVNYTDERKRCAPLIIRFHDEKHTGQIMPTTEEGVAELARQMKNSDYKIEPRGTKKAQFQVSKWNVKVKTEKDGITVLKGPDGRPQYPSDQNRSMLFGTIELVCEAYNAEVRGRIGRGDALVAAVAKKKMSAADLIALVAKENGPFLPGGTILTSDGMATLRKQCGDTTALNAFVTIAPTTKIAVPMQDTISNQAKKNAGMAMPNPLTRFAMEFGDTSKPVALYDKTKPYMLNGKQQYEAATVETVNAKGEKVTHPVTNDNIHKFVRSRSVLDGICDASAVCFSNLAISMPCKLSVGVVTPPVDNSVDVGDVYGEDDDDALPPVAEVPAAETPADAAAADAAAADAPAADPDGGDLGSMVDGLPY